MKKVMKALLLLLVIVYIFIYFSYKNGYYIKQNEETAILTDEKIKEYENDLKNGVDVSQKNYIVVHEHYDNIYTRFLLKLSNKIEKGFDSAIKFVFNKISNSINE